MKKEALLSFGERPTDLQTEHPTNWTETDSDEFAGVVDQREVARNERSSVASRALGCHHELVRKLTGSEKYR